MRDTSSSDPAATPRSRRALLAGGLGAVGAWLANAVAAPGVARAGVDGDVVLGSAGNASASTTKITVATNDFSAFWGHETGGSGVGVRGDADGGYGIGVWGNAPDVGGNGVKGTSAGQGVYGNGGLHGVYGSSTNGSGVTAYGGTYGVNGNSDHGTGVQGATGDGVGVRAAAYSASGRGVYATNTTGRAVDARSESGWGVYGRSDSAHGVHGVAPSGIGVYGESSAGTALYGKTTSGYALQTDGRVQANKVSGVATIGSGNKSVTVTPGVPVTSASFVLLTPRVNLGTRALWYTTNTTANTITIRISSARSSATQIAWLLLG